MSNRYMKWAEIDLDALIHNVNQIRRLLKPDTKIAAVVKANGYGHGALEITEYLLDAGVDFIVVSSLEEAVEIRKKFRKSQTMVLGFTPDENVEQAILHGVIQTIMTEEQAGLLSEKAEQLKMGVSCHIKIDTGMNRIGFKVNEESVEKIVRIAKLPNIHINGMFSHFATADEGDKSFAMQQLKKFHWMIDRLKENGIKIPILHMANSAAALDLPEAEFDMVRTGIVLYGAYPSFEVNREKIHLLPVMSLKTKVSNLQVMEEDAGISYGLTEKVSKGSKIATIPVGYADGFMRALSGKAEVLIKGQRAPIVGRICMDQCMVDVSHIEDVAIGELVVVFGQGPKECIYLEELADRAGTISYELMCMIGRRVPRVYIKKGEIVKITNYLL